MSSELRLCVRSLRNHRFIFFDSLNPLYCIDIYQPPACAILFIRTNKYGANAVRVISSTEKSRIGNAPPRSSFVWLLIHHRSLSPISQIFETYEGTKQNRIHNHHFESIALTFRRCGTEHRSRSWHYKRIWKSWSCTIVKPRPGRRKSHTKILCSLFVRACNTNSKTTIEQRIEKRTEWLNFNLIKKNALDSVRLVFHCWAVASMRMRQVIVYWVRLIGAFAFVKSVEFPREHSRTPLKYCAN